MDIGNRSAKTLHPEANAQGYYLDLCNEGTLLCCEVYGVESLLRRRRRRAFET